MYDLVNTNMIPLVVGGDSNVINNEKENWGDDQIKNSKEANTRSGMVERMENAFSKDWIEYCVKILYIIFFPS
ncbi:hypothetical protein H5410_052677 [Solanum commersonii]|uniref:Uncharacterized protein n=1 Tax=Solanum commersonii TaxID=4109 RepID=A0A9J5X267_SOLCO|nr:hypothetical protein H5410_052677 [Solanum commersonii]